MNKFLRKISPYLAIFIAFCIYMQYWSGVTVQCPHFCNRGYDDFAYRDDFIGLLNGSWPGNVIFYQSPLPGYYLGLIHAIFQHPLDNFVIPYLIQIFLTTLICALAYNLAYRLYSQAVGIVTVLLLGYYEFVKFYATTIEANVLITFFLTATLYCLLKYQIHHHRVFLISAAICLGLAVSGRTNNLILIGTVAVWFMLLTVPRQRFWTDISILVIVTLLTISPAVLHSSLAADRFVFVTRTGVYNFTMGNLPGAPGTYWNQAVEDTIEPSIRFITQQPIDWLLLMLRKFRLFFTFPWSPAHFHEFALSWQILWPTASFLYLYYFFKTFSPLRSLLHFSLIFYTASIVITHVEDEYRLPVLPIIFIFTSVTVVSLLWWLYSKVLTKTAQLHIQKPTAVFACALLVIALFGLKIPGSQVSYKVDSTQSEAVYGGVIVGQKFQVECSNLYQIRIKIFSANLTGSITFHLKEGSMEGPEVYSQVVNTAQLTPFDYHPLVFSAIPDSAGKQYIFYFDTSALKSADEGVFFAGGQEPFAQSLNRIDFTKRIMGGAFVSLGSLDGNLAFEASCQAGSIELIEIAIEQLAQKTSSPQIIKPLLTAIITISGLALVGSLIFIIYTVRSK